MKKIIKKSYYGRIPFTSIVFLLWRNEYAPQSFVYTNDSTCTSGGFYTGFTIQFLGFEFNVGKLDKVDEPCPSPSEARS